LPIWSPCSAPPFPEEKMFPQERFKSEISAFYAVRKKKHLRNRKASLKLYMSVKPNKDVYHSRESGLSVKTNVMGLGLRPEFLKNICSGTCKARPKLARLQYVKNV
jgi:hypothetical protein